MAREQSASRRFRFVNLDGSEPQAFGAVFKWGVVDRLLGRRRGSVASPAPRVEPNIEEPERPPAPGEPARLTWIGHASWLIQLDGVSLLIDPILFDSIGPGIRRFVPPGVPLAALPAIDLGWLASGYARTGSSQAIRCSKSHDRGSRVAKENTAASIRSRMKAPKHPGTSWAIVRAASATPLSARASQLLERGKRGGRRSSSQAPSELDRVLDRERRALSRGGMPRAQRPSTRPP